MSRRTTLMQRIMELRAQQDKLAEEEAACWTDLFITFDEINGVDVPVRHIDHKSGWVIGRLYAQPSPQLNTTALLEDPDLTPAARKAILRKVETVDPTLLEAAKIKGLIDEGLIERHTTVPPKQLRKVGPKPATKEERAELEDYVG